MQATCQNIVVDIKYADYDSILSSQSVIGQTSLAWRQLRRYSSCSSGVVLYCHTSMTGQGYIMFCYYAGTRNI